MAQRTFQPADPAFAERVRASFARQGFMREIGARIAALTPGSCEIELDYHDRLSQQHGYFHGGIVGTLADNAGGYAAFTLMPADASILTVEYKISLLAPAAGERLSARGTVVRAGHTLTVCRSSVYVRKGENERLCAEGLVTLMALHDQPDAPPDSAA